MNKTAKNTTIFATVALATFVAVSVFSPVKKSNADELDVGVNVSSVISLSTASDSVMMSAPVGGGFTSGNTSAIVLTNSAYGYTLAIEDTDSNTSMTSSGTEDEVSSNYLGSKTEDTLEENTWGFSVDGTKFYAIPKKNNPLILSRAMLPTSDDGATTTLTFGVKTSRYLTSGTYTNRIILTAYTNGVDGNPEGVNPSSNDPEELSDDFPEPYEEGEGTNENRLVLAKSMQDPKLKQYCANTYTPTANSETAAYTRYFNGNQTPKAIVKDKRDGNKYEIAKLADGRCWMVQNMKIINMTITSELSDVESDYTLPASDYDMLANRNFVDKAAYVHEERGGYYNWYTATAGTGYRGAIANATASICPKGWKLPSGGEDSEFATLGNVYTFQQIANVPAFTTYGYITTLAHGYQGGGLYWSYSDDNAYNARGLQTTSTDIKATGMITKDAGGHVRCILPQL